MVVSFKKIISLAWPIALTNVVSLIAVLVNTKIVANISSHYLYILSLYLPLNYFVISLFESLKVPATTIAAIAHGEKKYHLINEKLWLLYGVVFVCLAIPIILVISFPKLTAFLFSITNTDVLFEFQRFSIWMLVAAFGLTLFYISLSLYNGLSQPRKALIFSLSAIVLSSILTLVLAKTSTLGIESLPCAMIISYFFFLVIILIQLYRIRFLKTPSLYSLFSLKNYLYLRQLALPVFLTYSAITLMLLVINKLLMPFGNEILAGFGLAYRIQVIALLPAISIGVALGILVNQSYIDDRNFLIRGILKKGIISCVLLYILLTPFIWLLATKMMGCITANQHIINAAVMYLRIVGPSYIGLAICLVYFVYLDQTGLGLNSLCLTTLMIALELTCAKLALNFYPYPNTLYWVLDLGNFIFGGVVFFVVMYCPQRLLLTPKIIARG